MSVSAPSPIIPRIPFAKSTLANGLDVIVHYDPAIPVAGVNLWYHVGSKNEEPRQRGMAHLFEHLMFGGSENFPGDFIRAMQEMGAGVNGSTDADRTNYWEDVPAARLELALAMESDRMGYLLPGLTDERIATQKDVVINEYRQNYVNRPYGMVSRWIAEALYPPEHPYSWLTIGRVEDIEQAGRTELEEFFRRYYVPANASLCLAGACDVDQARALAERYFGDLPGGAAVPRMAPWVPVLDRDVHLAMHDRVELDRLHLVWHTVPDLHPDEPPLAVLGALLSRGKNARLYRRLIYDQQLARDVQASQSSREIAGTFSVVTTARGGVAVEAIRDAVLDELERIARDGPAADELRRVLTAQVAGFVYGLQANGGFGGKADLLNAYNVLAGDPEMLNEELDRYARVTPEAVQGVAQRYLRDARRLEVIVRRQPPAHRILDRRRWPDPAAPLRFEPPRPARRRLANGIPVLIVPPIPPGNGDRPGANHRMALPVVDLAAVVRGGAGMHGPELAGLASLTAEMLDEGTPDRTALEISAAAEAMGTVLSTSCGWDGSYASLQCLDLTLDESLDLWADVLLRPAMPDDQWERVRTIRLAALRGARDHADFLAGLSFARELFGPGHPYAAVQEGTERTVEALTLDMVRTFYRTVYTTAETGIVVAGAVDPERIVGLVDERLGAWLAADAVTRPELAPPPRQPTRVHVVHRPGSAQAVLRVGHLGVARTDPDYFALILLNQVLGGQFAARINMNLREDKGYTYGARSVFDFRRRPGTFVVSASVQLDAAAAAVGEIIREVRGIVTDHPATAEELRFARGSIIDGYVQDFATPARLVNKFSALLLYDLPDDHLSRYPAAIEAVTGVEALDAGRRHLHPDELLIVVVADADVVAEPLRRGGFGPVTVETPDGRDG